MDQSSRYAGLVLSLAHQALGLAVDASPHRPRPGEAKFSATLARPAARRLMGEAGETDSLAPLGEALAAAAEADRPRFADGLGHSRPVYHLLALHLYLTAGGQGEIGWVPQTSGDKAPGGETSGGEASGGEGDISLALWAALCRAELGEGVTQTVDALIDGQGPLREHGVEDQLDTWTYRELVGLHALDRLARLAGSERWRGRVREVTAYHQAHTQPDYTTYQPWALAAFAEDPATAMFADQQLHDTATHLSIEGGPGAVLPALLLADAAAVLGGDGGDTL